jgi:hypothetical protein
MTFKTQFAFHCTTCGNYWLVAGSAMEAHVAGEQHPCSKETLTVVMTMAFPFAAAVQNPAFAAQIQKEHAAMVSKYREACPASE